MVVLIVSADELLKNECTLENELNYLERIAQLPNHVEKIVCINKSDLLNSQQREQLKKSKSFPLCLHFFTEQLNI
jgi:putative ribosome biogenesis GTPase RsgA